MFISKLKKYSRGFLVTFFFFIFDVTLYLYSILTDFNSIDKFGIDLGSGNSMLFSLLFFLGYWSIMSSKREENKKRNNILFWIKKKISINN